MEIILFEPQIPQNTGNLVRTCNVTGATLTLVKPLGFSLNAKHLKRAGLDYWDNTSIQVIDDLEKYLEKTKKPFYFLSSKASKAYTEINFTSDSIIIFGSETSGLPKHFHDRWSDFFHTIPMKTGARCLNLANSACIVLYEALRQTNFIFS
ncbi:MAG TPA: tRNA (cytidine(34)-2'-O)-methyltransferase [Chlamydiales bacterium]|nr:tRNA (cytidine(34)-2'-O)-methyltransferase [Chlamydiales bacterium]